MTTTTDPPASSIRYPWDPARTGAADFAGVWAGRFAEVMRWDRWCMDAPGRSSLTRTELLLSLVRLDVERDHAWDVMRGKG